MQPARRRYIAPTMSLLDTFLHGNALTEIFIEGHNPYALQKLPSADLDALRQQMHSTESVQAYAIGRIVGAGRGVWVVTDQAAYLQRGGRHEFERVPLREVRSFEAERGRFGHVVRLHAEDRSWSLFGVDRDLAGHLHQALDSRGLARPFDDRPARTHWWRDSAPEGWAADCLRDLQLRLRPA